jgi:hypothetical protein
MSVRLVPKSLLIEEGIIACLTRGARPSKLTSCPDRDSESVRHAVKMAASSLKVSCAKVLSQSCGSAKSANSAQS